MRSSRHNQRWPRPRDGPSHRLAITVPCCAHFREGPVLAILAMLALKDALCVAPGGSAPLFPFRSAPWPPMFQAGTGKRRLNRTRKPARHDRSHALTTQKGTSWRCGNRGHFGVALTAEAWPAMTYSEWSGTVRSTIRSGRVRIVSPHEPADRRSLRRYRSPLPRLPSIAPGWAS